MITEYMYGDREVVDKLIAEDSQNTQMSKKLLYAVTNIN